MLKELAQIFYSKQPQWKMRRFSPKESLSTHNAAFVQSNRKVLALKERIMWGLAIL